MRNVLFGLIVVGFGFASCNKEVTPLTKQEIKQKIDSITNARIKELDHLSQRDLDHRIKIEVKVKVDSMVNALNMQKAKEDSALQARSQKKAKDTAVKVPAK